METDPPIAPKGGKNETHKEQEDRVCQKTQRSYPPGRTEVAIRWVPIKAVGLWHLAAPDHCCRREGNPDHGDQSDQAVNEAPEG